MPSSIGSLTSISIADSLSHPPTATSTSIRDLQFPPLVVTGTSSTADMPYNPSCQALYETIPPIPNSAPPTAQAPKTISDTVTTYQTDSNLLKSSSSLRQLADIAASLADYAEVRPEPGPRTNSCPEPIFSSAGLSLNSVETSISESVPRRMDSGSLNLVSLAAQTALLLPNTPGPSATLPAQSILHTQLLPSMPTLIPLSSAPIISSSSPLSSSTFSAPSAPVVSTVVSNSSVPTRLPVVVNGLGGLDCGLVPPFATATTTLGLVGKNALGQLVLLSGGHLNGLIRQAV
ncbi:unnamed protein product [Protopolystoma xenopodis]|uniref:Uncharacterized protein n=1 Tax=Protopolystoma xenopodis TaxID=117903 RepID=A0A3S4ZV58_9PLAT|nr:unnamed protein product [Protopolystoma xenopodis]